MTRGMCVVRPGVGSRLLAFIGVIMGVVLGVVGIAVVTSVWGSEVRGPRLTLAPETGVEDGIAGAFWV